MKQIENLYLLYRSDIYNYLYSLTHDPDLAEDLLSETFISAIYAIRNFKGQCSVKTWLISIARNMWLRYLRKEKSMSEFNDLLGIYLCDDTQDELITKETAKRIAELLKQKDERTQITVNMRTEGYSYAEIARKANISESSARVIDFRTKKWLKAILKKEGLI